MLSTDSLTMDHKHCQTAPYFKGSFRLYDIASFLSSAQGKGLWYLEGHIWIINAKAEPYWVVDHAIAKIQYVNFFEQAIIRCWFQQEWQV